MSIPFSEGIPTQHTETPEAADQALSQFFGDSFFSPQTINARYEAKIAHLRTPGREHMSDWMLLVQEGMDGFKGVSLTDEQQAVLDRFIAHGSEVERRHVPKLYPIYFATQSHEKQAILRKVADDLGIPCVFSPDKAWSNEDALQKISFIKTEPLYSQVRVYAGHKHPHYPQETIYEQRKQPVLGFDTGVGIYTPDPDETQMMLKPKTPEEAKAFLEATSGKDIVVYTGISLTMATAKARMIDWQKGVGIRLSLKDFSDQDIAAYLEAVGSKALSVSGGIDYASVSGQRLIDSSKAISIISTAGNPTETDWNKGLQLPTSSIDTLQPYFKGIPTHAVKQVVKGIPSLFEPAV